MTREVYSNDLEAVQKRDYATTLQELEEKKGTRDYHEILTDFHAILNDWYGHLAEEVIKPAYPGWERSDFSRLLNDLGDPHHETREETERKRRAQEYKHREEEIDEIIKLGLMIQEMEARLRFLTSRHIPTHALEELRASAQFDLDWSTKNWKKLGLWQKITDGDLRRNTQKNNEDNRKRIKDLDEQIRQHPLSERQEQKRLALQQEQEEIQNLRSQLTEAKQRLAELSEKK